MKSRPSEMLSHLAREALVIYTSILATIKIFESEPEDCFSVLLPMKRGPVDCFIVLLHMKSNVCCLLGLMLWYKQSFSSG